MAAPGERQSVSALNIPPPTGEAPAEKAASEDGPQINLDLHQVAIERENLNSGTSLHD